MVACAQHLESRGRKTGGQSQPGLHDGGNKTIKGRKSGHREWQKGQRGSGVPRSRNVNLLQDWTVVCEAPLKL